jgi:hypothetical protein
MTVGENEFGVQERRLVGKYNGTVVNNKDPEKLGRVTVMVPNLLEPESEWARPEGMVGGGGANRGFYAPPPVGADVWVTFADGDPDLPVYSCGHWGIGETSLFHKDDGVTPDEAPEVPEMKFGRWRVTFDNRPGKEICRIQDSTQFNFRIELDGATGGISIEAPYAISFKTATFVVDAANVIINERRQSQVTGSLW